MDGWKIGFLVGMASWQVRTVSFREGIYVYICIYTYTYTIYCYSIRRRSWVMWKFGMQTSSSWAGICYGNFLPVAQGGGLSRWQNQWGERLPFKAENLGVLVPVLRIGKAPFLIAVMNHEILQRKRGNIFLKVIQMWLVFEVIVVPRPPLDRRDTRWAWQLPWVFFWCFSMWWSSIVHLLILVHGTHLPPIFPMFLQNVEGIHPCFTSPLVASDRVGP